MLTYADPWPISEWYESAFSDVIVRSKPLGLEDLRVGEVLGVVMDTIDRNRDPVANSKGDPTRTRYLPLFCAYSPYANYGRVHPKCFCPTKKQYFQ